MDHRLREDFEKKARDGEGSFAIAVAILELADSQTATARALNKLGVADASTPFGAIEALAAETRGIAKAVESLAGSVQEVGSILENSDGMRFAPKA